jgi:hypothetical protein
MNRLGSFAVVVLLTLVAALAGLAAEEKTRNPFQLQDVPDPDGDDVKAFAAKVKLAGDARDANAAQWVEKATAGKAKSLDGEWSSRWNGGSSGENWTSGTATVKTVGGRVYILYKDQTGTYLIDARRDKTRLVGRYVNVNSTDDTSPWVGLIVNNERIDGIWGEGRWDLRRKLAARGKSE